MSEKEKEKEKQNGNWDEGGSGSGGGEKPRNGHHIHAAADLPAELKKLLDEYQFEGGEVREMPSGVGVLDAGDIILVDMLLSWVVQEGLPAFLETYFDVESPLERVKSTIAITIKAMLVMKKFEALSKIARHMIDEENAAEAAKEKAKADTGK